MYLKKGSRCRVVFCFVSAALLTACSAAGVEEPVQVVSGTVGPASHAEQEKEPGQLIVWTDTNTIEQEMFVYRPHVSYDLYDCDGRHVRKVRNHLSVYDETPSRVRLSPGAYRVRTRRTSGDLLELEVVIESGRRTEVVVEDLGSFSPPAREPVDE